MTGEERLIRALHAGGYRLTRQRRLVMEVLEESAEHLDAETLHDRAKARDPNISLATVYRTLTLLKEVGLVEEHRLGEDHAHYEAVQEDPHYHFTCLKCGRVVEFDAPQVIGVVQELSEREGLQVTDVHLFLSGYCAQCR
jgi:Fur family ferric uptake transcriptional regulator